ncbi:hypothetical protein O7621_00535 [Solwaraspora sp. WMMD937]|uniref:hypothetical protein n=1 Tax=Solwaraspora sp. WMMD937 TaxID=3016090 RepID=UPI00249BA03F|nr:hypothetical protein [Solwaraspora sp. WMMD937]WFE21916.1 hypothetical protein O7621_00535 [Solwaraspora sp. WMMD937]
MSADVGLLLARLLAGPVSRMLDVVPDEGQSRAQTFLMEVAAPWEDAADLLLRQLSRSVVWFVAFCVTGLAELLLVVVVSIVFGDLPDVVFQAIALPAAFMFAVSMVHLLKLALVHYTPEAWWTAPAGLKKWLMLAQLPELVVAGIAAVLVASTV